MAIQYVNGQFIDDGAPEVLSTPSRAVQNVNAGTPQGPTNTGDPLNWTSPSNSGAFNATGTPAPAPPMAWNGSGFVNAPGANIPIAPTQPFGTAIPPVGAAGPTPQVGSSGVQPAMIDPATGMPYASTQSVPKSVGVGANAGTSALGMAAAAGGYGNAVNNPNPVANANPNFQGGFVAPRSISEDQQNTNSLLTSAVTGSGVVGTDGKVYSPADVMANLARQGNPLGTAWVNANTGFREDKIGAAGADQQAAYKALAGQFASGQAAQQNLGAAQQAAGKISGAGQNDLNLAHSQAVNASGTAVGMGQDIAGLRAAASGAVPSAAQIQQQQGISQAINSQAALAAGARGGNLAAAMRGAQAAGSGIQAQGIANNAALRANEMATARGQLSQATGIQGQLFNQAGALGNTAAQTAVGRQTAAAGQLGSLGSTALNAQQVGMGATGNAYEQDQARTMNQVNVDQDEQRQLQNYMLQLFNTTNGNAASIDNSQRAAAVQTRGQDLQLAGAAAAGVGGLAGAAFGAK